MDDDGLWTGDVGAHSKIFPFDPAFRNLSLLLDRLFTIKNVSQFLRFPENTHIWEDVCINNTYQFTVKESKV